MHSGNSSASHQSDNTSSGKDNINGLVIARYGNTADIEMQDRTLKRCAIRKSAGPIVCGDHVKLEMHDQNECVVTGIQERRNLLSRPDKSGEEKRIAANIDQILIVCAATPLPATDQIDRYIIAAELLDITPVLLVNKTDLLDTSATDTLETHLRHYREIGYKLVYSSTKLENGLEQLRQALSGRTSILVGNSGVGKSSIVKCLLPEIAVRIAEVSAKTGLGKHTTTTAHLYHLPGDGHIIDSPGIRQFSLWSVKAEDVEKGFREFRDYRGKCRFHNCRHTGEPGCIIAKAAESGEISRKRLDGYRRILDSVSE